MSQQLSSAGHAYCISIPPHEELVIMEILKRYPEKPIAEALDKLYTWKQDRNMLEPSLLFEEEQRNSKEGW